MKKNLQLAPSPRFGRRLSLVLSGGPTAGTCLGRFKGDEKHRVGDIVSVVYRSIEIRVGNFSYATDGRT